jgi:predicted site-specific integrase-resolvase
MADLTVKQAADRLKVNPTTITRWIKEFPHAYKLNPNLTNSPYRIPEQDVTAFEQRRKGQ